MIISFEKLGEPKVQIDGRKYQRFKITNDDGTSYEIEPLIDSKVSEDDYIQDFMGKMNTTEDIKKEAVLQEFLVAQELERQQMDEVKEL